jgi:hypothetical protein
MPGSVEQLLERLFGLQECLSTSSKAECKRLEIHFHWWQPFVRL